MDPVTKQKYLMCSKSLNSDRSLSINYRLLLTDNSNLCSVDPPGSCKRMRCECDKNLAEKLQEYESQWNIQNHRRWGSPPFEQEKYCTITHPGT